MRAQTRRTQPKAVTLPAEARSAFEIRFRSKGTKESYRAATLFWGNEAVERARNYAQEFVSTYGDLEFAIFFNGALFERVA